MKEQTLAEFVATHSQAETADIMGLYQGTVSKMLTSKRDIRLVFDRKRSFSHYYEVKIKKPQPN